MKQNGKTKSPDDASEEPTGQGITHIGQLTPDPANANKGTQRGLSLLDDSLRKHGAGRSILIDRNGRIIAGNKTAERAADIGLDELIVVQTDGKKLVAVQRTDLDLNDPEARMLAYADNRTGEVDLSWNIEQLLADVESGLPIADLWNDAEFAALLEGAANGLLTEGDGKAQEIPEQFMILIECQSEVEQAKLLERFTAEGLQCKALIS